jgi:pSer/pThr/pTyr-binding forkhead associated (FHA) protein
MSRPYLPPAWSADNAKVDLCFFLEVLKDGAIVDKVELNEEMSSSGNGASGMIGNKRSYFKAGRQEDAVDVVLQHASISRVHAILQYRDDGALMLLDQGTQGTQVNKKACEQGAYQRLYVGDVIVFGASTRK